MPSQTVWLALLVFLWSCIRPHGGVLQGASSVQSSFRFDDIHNNSIMDSSVSVAGKSPEQPVHTINENLSSKSCSLEDISVTQNQDPGGGISQYRVEIQNICAAKCSAYKVHLHCGSFASATLVNPHIFKRIHIDDCLVNGGKAVVFGSIITFTYENEGKFTLSPKSATFSC